MAPDEHTAKRQKLSPGDDVPPSASSNASSQDARSNRSSWYDKTWPRKAAPITQVARESISSASNSAIEAASVVKDKVTSNSSRRSSLALTLGKSASSKALPVIATATKDHALPQGKRLSRDTRSFSSSSLNPRVNTDTATTSTGEQVQTASQPDTAQSTSQTPSKEPNADPVQVAAPRSWIGWLAGGDGSLQRSDPGTQPQDKKDEPKAVGKSHEVPSDEPKKKEQPQAIAQLATEAQPDGPLPAPPAPAQSNEQPEVALQRRSWLPIWSNTTASQSAPSVTSPVEVVTKNNEAVVKDVNVVKSTNTETSQPGPPQTEATITNNEGNTTSQTAPAPNRSSAWVFWSRDKPAETQSLKDAPREGEIAVANTETENKPRRASIDLQNASEVGVALQTNAKPTPTPKHKAKSSISKSNDVDRANKTTKVENKAASATAIAPAEAKTSRPASPVPTKKNYDHLLLPALHDTLKIPENPTLWQQLARLFYSAKDPDFKHLNLVKDPPKVKNALAIGVHGYFPAPLIQSVLGRPTGTSIKFADMAAKAIKRYTTAHGYECNVKTAALEGEGRIAERIDLLWKLLLNWIDEIRKADFVMVACHSQGVPVAILLVAKLIHFGCISGARVGICAMAGVNMGPFPEFKSRWISGSAGELFEFSDPSSKVSKDYLAALDDVLKFGVRLIYVGSIDDQLVSMESSIFAPVSHPHIYRAVSIDSRLHAPNFVSHLVAFALKLRNLGVQDHGLIRELSAPLAGSLYTGEGHSRLYEDDSVYDLAVSFALETTCIPDIPLVKRNIDPGANNPFILPFAMRGILEEDFVKSDLQDEAAQLLRQFDEWKPQTKALKDVKFRLEGIRSKL